MSSKGKQIAQQGAVLALASFIVRIIGVLYRAPMALILGDEGMGYYNYAFNIYMYLLILSSYAMPTAISKIVSEKIALKQRGEAHHLFKASVILNILISAVFSVLLYLIAEPYTNYFNMPGSAIAIKSLAPSLVIFAIMSSFRGYFQGLHTMMPTAVSQVIEQVFNVIFSLLLSFLLMTKSVEWGAAGGTIGTGAGAFAGLLFLIVVYYMYKSRLPKEVIVSPLTAQEIPQYWKVILMTSVPMIIGTATFNLSTIIDDAMFSKALYFHSYSFSEISTMIGILGAKYTLILTMPIAVAAAISTASIPSVSSAVAKKDYGTLKNRIEFTLKSTMIIAIPASIGIFALAGPILKILFDLGDYEKITTDILRIGAITVWFFSLSTVSIGLLQGMGYVRIPVESAVKSIVIKAAFNFVVFFAFNLNLYGAAYANIVFSFVSAFFNLSAIRQKTKIKLIYADLFWRPLGASVIMGVVALLSYLSFDFIFPAGYFGNLLSTFFAIFLAMITYFILIIRFGVITGEELKGMPYGAKLSALAEKIV